MVADGEKREMECMAEMCEARAAACIYSAAPPDVRARHGISTRKVGAATALVCAAATGGALNDVTALGIKESAIDLILNEIMAIYGSMRSRFTVRLSPAARPSDLANRLKALGFTLSGLEHKMYRSINSAPTIPTEFRVE